MKLAEKFDITKSSKMVLTEKPPKNAIIQIGNETYRVYYRRGNIAYVQLIKVFND